ncbi:antitoxin [Paenibacillus sambharensis]|uniref:Arabinogalactan endo-beta-1,4-galactanase n=1 Tax=Paenibacillus sambharensis TaxID=1803190 RepID=A0A2W1L6G9_9BACL|nr:arabinogalactan endo-1,4-beta-galactosidase [Paenibacillus sambharensis]PZD95778.1 antitoxin [Paenibacillus sambharensis]
MKNHEGSAAQARIAPKFINGMDVSFLDEIEQGGGTFSDQGAQEDCMVIMKNNGVNSIRLRIWNEPAGGYCNLERTLLMARRIKDLGLHFLLDFHYSDKWADPGQQSKPAAWAELGYNELKAAVYQYTREVLEALQAQGTLPDMVQVGNEITPGMLWDDGKVDGDEYNNDAQWERFSGLVKSGINACKDVDAAINVMVHIDRGGDNASSIAFYDRFEQLGVRFDTIGLSFYPWWHGTLEDLKHNLNDLAERYGKEVIVVETAYPWTLDKTAGHTFVMEKEELLHEGYPATPEGQTKYLRDFITIVKETAGGLGAGFYWWEPSWIPCKQEWSVGHENNWSNLTMFDFEGRKLPSLKF